jgi:hypothetical protein
MSGDARPTSPKLKVPAVIAILAENDLPMLPTGKVERQGLVRVLSGDRAAPGLNVT